MPTGENRQEPRKVMCSRRSIKLFVRMPPISVAVAFLVSGADFPKTLELWGSPG